MMWGLWYWCPPFCNLPRTILAAHPKICSPGGRSWSLSSSAFT